MAHPLNGKIPTITGNGCMQDIVPPESALQTFVRAKQKINAVYEEIEEYVSSIKRFVEALDLKEHNVVDKAKEKLLDGFVHKIKAVREMIARDQMKVAFFGRTSNGKSTTINAMLRERILPTGIGHTTNCFCQIEGSDEAEPYLMEQGSEHRVNVANIKQLANALCQEKLDESSLARIFWPRERCVFLRSDVVFVDTPGVDFSQDSDDYIEKYCLNADVFVFVLNAESTITLAEKQFFHIVSEKLSKPNVFILHNRWDASDNEPENQESVKSQHTERSIEFLAEELKVCSEQEASERIFFVSAREALQARVEGAKCATSESFQKRYNAFEEFERKFEKCISRSAVKTKFEQHCSRGQSMLSDVCSLLDDVCERISTMLKMKSDQKTLLKHRMRADRGLMRQLKREIKRRIRKMVEEVEQQVCQAMSEEICSLDILIDEFKMPFRTEPIMLKVYKEQLNSYVEAELGSNLHARLSSTVAINVEAAHTEIMDRMHAVLPNEELEVQTNMTSNSSNFQMIYSLDWQHLCADFQEDVDFKFSWGISAMFQRFTGKLEQHRRNYNANFAASNPLPTPVWHLLTPVNDIVQQPLSAISSFGVSSTAIQSTFRGVAVAGVVCGTVGWRFLLGISAIYGCIYLYERLSWTNSAKERAFKAQYVRHATKKLKMIVDMTSANCSHQVQREISNCFARLCGLVEHMAGDMNEGIKTLETQVTALEESLKQLKVLRNKAERFQRELHIFESEYISLMK